MRRDSEEHRLRFRLAKTGEFAGHYVASISPDFPGFEGDGFYYLSSPHHPCRVRKIAVSESTDPRALMINGEEMDFDKRGFCDGLLPTKVEITLMLEYLRQQGNRSVFCLGTANQLVVFRPTHSAGYLEMFQLLEEVE